MINKAPMRLRILLIIVSIFLSASLKAQELSLTFTSVTDAKFYLYINGVLQNQKSRGMVTVKGLESKEYHIRVVIDDPYEIASTLTIKPDAKHSEYTVRFNAVKERVYVKPASRPRKSGDEEWQPSEAQETASVVNEEKPRSKHKSLLPDNMQDSATQRVMNHIRLQSRE
ncbi:MAG: hypothetical protein K6D59_10010 [Bacteroidales bacterium]|nr:hypothetical protein [Bacteroidales bacterium]